MTINEEQPQTEAKTDTDTQATEVQEPVPTAPAAQGQGSGPWASDLESRFQDPNVRTQVDTFLRETVQPYVTQLETRSKPSEEQEIAYQLYQDFQTDPSSTYLAITEELFGEEGAAAIQEALASTYGFEEDDSEPYDEDSYLDPRLEENLEYLEAKRAQEAYDNALEQLDKSRGDDDPEINRDLFHPFVVAAEGDVDLAYERYKEWYDTARSELGSGEVEQAEDSAPQAPAVIGSDAQAPAAPPVEKTYSSLDEALDDFFAEQKSAAPPTVGAV